jgi:hypothetical protein
VNAGIASPRAAGWPLRLVAPLVAGLMGWHPAAAAELRPHTVEAWQRYVRAVEDRIDREMTSDSQFLGIDFEDAEAATTARKTLLSGGVVVDRLAAKGHDAEEISVPDGLINHWRGAIFVPGVTLDQALLELQSPSGQRHKQEDVLESRVLYRDGDTSRVYLKLVRKKIVTVTFNTEHDVRYQRLAPSKAVSRSVSTKIAELEEAGTPNEREKPVGHDRGFMWRLNSYWRYEQVAGGVIVELESLTLSRGIPALIKFIARPIINSIARESMTRTLESMRERLQSAATAAMAEGRTSRS